MNTTYNWGWDSKRETEFEPFLNEGWKPGRVIQSHRGSWLLGVNGTPDSPPPAKLTGKALDNGCSPVTGDWVYWKDQEGTTLIGGILERRTCISRQAVGRTSRQQIMGTNVDVLCVVQALGPGRGFTTGAIERYMTLAWESGCRPVVILNKADLSDYPEESLMDAQDAAPGVDVFLCSTLSGEGIPELGEILHPGQTAAFIGPSGAGKSSLINALAGEDFAEFGAVRQNDSRGRHTTTDRRIHRLPNGILLLDTPGLREISVWGTAADADADFPEIEEAAEACKFRDCSHNGEPGCGVHKALELGEIRPERFESWLELRKELAYLENRRGQSQRENPRKKEIAKLSRQIQKKRRFRETDFKSEA